MPDAARVAQAVPLEVPVVLRGAKISPETGKPELFTETARTILVFDNGVVLNVHSRLAVGQTVYIHNTQNGREMLCKVLEAPPDNEPGFTDLEFTTAAPDFWGTNLGNDAQPSEPNASAAAPETFAAPTESPERAAMTEPTGQSADDPLAMMLETANKIDVPSMTDPSKESGMPLREELMSAHEMAPDPNAVPVRVPDFEPAATTDRPSTEPTGEQIDAALKQMTSAGTPLTGAEEEGTSDEKHIAALMARDARLAKFAAFKERQQAEKSQRPAASDEAPAAPATASRKASESKPEAEPHDREVKTIASKPSIAELLTTGKNATYSTIGACALIAVALVFVWRAMHVPLIQLPDTPVAVSAVPPQPDPASSAAVETVRPVKPAGALHGSNAARVMPNSGEPRDGAGTEPRAERRGSTANPADFLPAKVLSQPQPTLPPWAANVDVYGTITLEVTIDQNGNVAETKALSGPRLLQREAERAIGLWQFEPARANGKPTSSHLTLVVQFLPPPPPKVKYPYN